jgi:hypothetical protein
MPARLDDHSDIPNELSPEWTEYESAWAVDVVDFGSPLAAAKFLISRKKFFRAAQESGVSKEMLTPFEPNKPGFEDRVLRAFETIKAATKQAAE